MDRQSIREEIRRLVKDTDSTNARWSDVVLNARIDISHDNIASETKCIPYRYTTSIVANTAEYLMEDYFLKANEVMILNDNSEWRPLTKRNEGDLDQEDNNWRARTGTPQYWYQRINYVGIVPYPTTATTNGLRIDMARLPTAFTTDTDIPFDSVKELYPYHKVLCYDVALSCALDDGLEKQYVLFKKELDDYIKKIVSQVNNKSSETRMTNVYDSLRVNNRRTR